MTEFLIFLTTVLFIAIILLLGSLFFDENDWKTNNKK